MYGLQRDSLRNEQATLSAAVERTRGAMQQGYAALTEASERIGAMRHLLRDLRPLVQDEAMLAEIDRLVALP